MNQSTVWAAHQGGILSVMNLRQVLGRSPGADQKAHQGYGKIIRLHAGHMSIWTPSLLLSRLRLGLLGGDLDGSLGGVFGAAIV